MSIETNCVRAGGVLVKKEIFLGRNDETKREWVTANLTLRVGENEEITISMFSNKLNGMGNESPIYKNIMTIKDEYKALESVMTDKVRGGKDAKPIKLEATTVATMDECDFVYANKGITLSTNRYVRDGEIMESFRLNTRFINRAKETDSREPFIEGNLIGVVSKSAVELEDGDKTYVKMELTVPEYYEPYGDREESIHIDKFELVLRDVDQDTIDYCVGTFEENVVASIGIRPTVKVVVAEKPKEEPKAKRGFGFIPTFEPTTRIVREISMIGGYDLEPEEYENEKAFDLSLYSKGVEKFEKTIEDMKNNNGKSTTISKGFGKASRSSDTSLPF